MSTKTDISEVRRRIASNKLDPILALNKMTESFNRLIEKVPDNSIIRNVMEWYVLYYEMANGSTIGYNSYGHNKQWFDAKIREMGDEMLKIEKKLKPKKAKKKKKIS